MRIILRPVMRISLGLGIFPDIRHQRRPRPAVRTMRYIKSITCMVKRPVIPRLEGSGGYEPFPGMP